MKSFASKLRLFALVFAVLGCLPLASHAQSGVCNDGTTTNAQSKRGACSGHGGVKTWNGPQSTPAAPTPAPSAAPAPAPTPAPRAQSQSPSNSGGGGQVWVNLPTKVYHCQGDRWYGKTKSGQYMSEADATRMGARPDHGKSCSAR